MKRVMVKSVAEDRIFYYTSNYVLESWLKSEKIWATRSISSNDASDTIYAISLFPEINSFLERTYETELKDAKAILQLNQGISKKFYKDLLYYMMTNHYEEIEEIISNEKVERKEWFYYGNNYELFKIEDRYEYCGSFHLEYLKNPNREQWIFHKILRTLNEQELAKFLNLPIITIRRCKKIVKQLPFIYQPFVICFTMERDNRFLWDSYTGNKGVALEFSKSELKKYLEMKYNNSSYPCMVEDIIYDKQKQIQEIARFIDETEGELLFNGVESLCSIIAKYKHPYWKVENEIRAIFCESYFEDGSLIKENYKLKYRDDLISQDYIEIEIPHNLVKSVMIGPQNNMKEENSKLFKQMLEKFDVSFSEGSGICRC